MKRPALQNKGGSQFYEWLFWDFLETSPSCKRSYLYGSLSDGFSKCTAPCFSLYLSGQNSRRPKTYSRKEAGQIVLFNCGVLYSS